ncbi:MAG: FumA C-terminus/TtdB family hydratase beta subunit [Clostridiales bacterium]|jgi:fumarate hydratase subunit beta|nr:FumA C-terminus/TtdB family hydratase beta subunit [Clostridiales bacterium]
MNEIREITTPLTDEIIQSLSCGEMVYITGKVYTARDLAHGRIMVMLDAGEAMPFEFTGNIVFYAGPSPAPPGKCCGSIGPTTAGRMDLHSPTLIAHGLKAMMGKGLRADPVRAAIRAHGGIYFAAIGGVAALMSKSIKSVEIVAFEDLGTEAVRLLEVEKFPAIVAIDSRGCCIYDR